MGTMHYPPLRNANRSALEEALRRIEALGAETYERDLANGERILLAEPWRIGRSIFGITFHEEDWAPTGSATFFIDLLTKCRRMREDAQAEGIRDEGNYERNRLMSLLQAERALATKIEKGDYR